MASPYEPAVAWTEPIRLFWNRRCRTCEIPLLDGERSGWCCGPGGKYQDAVPILPRMPAEYRPIIYEPRISGLSRKLNLLFSFAALETDALLPNTQDGFVAIQGKLYHRVRPTHAGTGFRWLLYDGYHRDRAPARDWLSEIPAAWTDAVAKALMRVNPLSSILQNLSATLEAPDAYVTLEDRGHPEIVAMIRHDHSTPGDLGPRTMVIMTREPSGTEYKRRVPATSRFWEPLAYPLLFPHGTLGWGVREGEAAPEDDQQINEAASQDKPTTQIWYYRRRLLQDERFQLFGRLTNEYLVDMFSRNLELRLQYIERNQRRIRAHEAQQRRAPDAELMENEDHNPSENVYLPASFLGSRRWAAEQVADELTLAAFYGAPTFFITMTCSPEWPEIRECLLPGQTYSDVPLIVCRVFAQKLKLLLAKLSELFAHAGQRQYTIHVVEFQKRGLPHAHILIKFSSPCTNPEDIDACVSAEMPVDEADAALVKKFMIHSHGPYCLRQREGRIPECRFGYPKPIQHETTIDDEGRVHYRRRSEEDRMVVPYNIHILRAFNCHVNVEVANPSKLFQYMFKYTAKGPDRARFAVIGNDPDTVVNEIEEYLSARYLTATEAAWRILGKSITQKIPGVTPLPVHLPESISFHQYHRRNGQHSQMSLLIRYFYRPDGQFMNTQGDMQDFTTLKYAEYYQYFRLDTLQPGEFADPARGKYLERLPPPNQPRKMVHQRDPRRPHLTRLMALRPSAGEVFYLRALLNHRPARSFEELRTIAGTIYATFQEAATVLGLFQHQREAQMVMAEAVAALYTPREIRWLFVDLLVHDSCHNPIQIWDNFRDELIYDYFLRNGQILAIAIELALQDLAYGLELRGHTLAQHGLPEPQGIQREVMETFRQWHGDPDRLWVRAEDAIQRLNAEQRAIYTEVIRAVVHKQPLYLFIDGKAGRGKTFLLNAICDAVRANGLIVIPTATSAFAAQLYPGGRTAHSVFKIPVEEMSEMLESNIEPHHPRGELLIQARVLIWDEAPMTTGAALQCVDALLRRLMENDLPFGGKIMILVGDFRQTCPVIRGGTRAQVVAASIRSSPLWEVFGIRRLTVPIRNAEDPDFADFVDAIGDGAGPDVPLAHMLDVTTVAEGLIEFMFPDDILQQPPRAVKRAILAPTNDQVEDYNNIVLDTVQGLSKTYTAFDSIKEATDAGLPEEVCSAILDYVARRTPPGAPPHDLRVKVGGIYRLMRNMSPERGCIKNVRAVVHQAGRRLVAVQLLRPENNFQPDNHITLLPRIPFEIKLSTGHTLVRRQFPIAAAYATTFNSCQGLTLDRAGIDLTRPVFSHGQLYTALSRLRNRFAGKVRLPPGEFGTKNVTYHELLL